jgi:hypothetical protein
VREISLPQGFDLHTVQPVASSCTDYAIPTHVSFSVTITSISACQSLVGPEAQTNNGTGA